MDAKEAIKILEVLTTTTESKTKKEAFSLAVEALEKVPVLEAENARLKINAEKWADLLKRAGAVGLNENDFFKMVETDKE